MRAYFKPILIIFLVATAVLIGVLLYINSQIQKGISGTFVKSSNADVSVKRVRYTETRDGRKEWELEADSAQHFKSDNLTIFENVKIVFYSKDGMSYTLSGKNGRLRHDTRDVDIEGNVVVFSEDGYELKTETLQYSAAIKQIRTTERVFFTGPNISVEGVGFWADIGEEKLFILDDVKTVLKNVAI